MPFLAVFGRFDALLGRERYNLSLALFYALKTKNARASQRRTF